MTVLDYGAAIGSVGATVINTDLPKTAYLKAGTIVWPAINDRELRIYFGQFIKHDKYFLDERVCVYNVLSYHQSDSWIDDTEHILLARFKRGPIHTIYGFLFQRNSIL